jgi:phosphinothricin acetyltransferase
METRHGGPLVISICDARPDDAEAISAIYAHHVLHGTASFEEEPPSVAAWREKIAMLASRRWPFLVAQDGDEVVGYAYVTQFRDRAAYAFTCENSIYVDPQRLGEGIGRLLLERLIEASREAGFRQMIGVIGGGEPASVALHRGCGFADAGRMKSVGFKFGKWLDTVYMQRELGSEDGTPNG